MLVSVIIPSFNDGAYISSAIQSIQLQTYPSSKIELIVVDDGSTDDTSTIAKQLGSKVIKQENCGLPAARNAGIKYSTGSLILPLDADDRIHPQYIEKAVLVLSARNEIGVVHTHRQHFGELTTIKFSEQFSIEALKDRCMVNYCSMFRKEVWADCGGYDQSMILGFEDWDFWFRVYKAKWQFHLIEEVLFYYRKHSNRLSHIAQKKCNNTYEYFKTKA